MGYTHSKKSRVFLIFFVSLIAQKESIKSSTHMSKAAQDSTNVQSVWNVRLSKHTHAWHVYTIIRILYCKTYIDISTSGKYKKSDRPRTHLNRVLSRDHHSPSPKHRPPQCSVISISLFIVLTSSSLFISAARILHTKRCRMRFSLTVRLILLFS